MRVKRSPSAGRIHLELAREPAERGELRGHLAGDIGLLGGEEQLENLREHGAVRRAGDVAVETLLQQKIRAVGIYGVGHEICPCNGATVRRLVLQMMEGTQTDQSILIARVYHGLFQNAREWGQLQGFCGPNCSYYANIM